MTTDFGLDMWSEQDLIETREVSGVRLVAQDALWRLQTKKAQGIMQADASNYGIDLLDEIGSVQTDSDAAALPDKIRNELQDDERIDSVDVTVTRTVDGPAVRFDIRIACQTAEGPFSLVGTADSAGLKLDIQLLPGGI